MHNAPTCGLLVLLLPGCAGGGGGAVPGAPGGVARRGGDAEDALDRAIDHLVREVPRWPEENGCFSCHHNGDAARALFAAGRSWRESTAARAGAARAAGSALTSTTEWLSRPERWDHQKGDPGSSDKALARLQFAAALAAALDAGAAIQRRAVEAAGESVVNLQGVDGAWAVEPRGSLGSPATWGTPLATAMTRRSLEAMDPRRFAGSIERARKWLLAAPAHNVLEAAAVLIGLAGDGEGASPRAGECLALIERGRSPGGGWGPYASSPPEPFDTAVVLLALRCQPRADRTREWIREGRAFLIASQEEEGGWPATTRPRGGVSHAQATSTSAWAALALLLTEEDG